MIFFSFSRVIASSFGTQDVSVLLIKLVPYETGIYGERMEEQGGAPGF